MGKVCYFSQIMLKSMPAQYIVGFHMTSLKFKQKNIDPTEILLLRCITAAEH